MVYQMKNGSFTNCQYTAKASFTDPTMEERAIAIFRLQVAINKMLKVVSVQTLADSFNLSVREFIRVARWNDSKHYRQPLHSLVIEMLNDL